MLDNQISMGRMTTGQLEIHKSTEWKSEDWTEAPEIDKSQNSSLPMFFE